jgi:hypothetical protein
MEWATQEKNAWKQPAENGSGPADVMEPVSIPGVPLEDKAGTAHADSPETSKKNCNWN